MGELGRQRVAGATAQAAERAGIKPAPGLIGVDDAARVGDEVAAVADHDRVTVEHLGQLTVDPHRMQRGPRIGQLGRFSGSLLVLDRPQRGNPRLAFRGPRGAGVRGRCRAGQRSLKRRRQRPVELGTHRARVVSLRLGDVDHDHIGSPARTPHRSRGESRAGRRRPAPRPLRPALGPARGRRTARGRRAHIRDRGR